jgi:hypothetical protein
MIPVHRIAVVVEPLNDWEAVATKKTNCSQAVQHDSKMGPDSYVVTLTFVVLSIVQM